MSEPTPESCIEDLLGIDEAKADAAAAALARIGAPAVPALAEAIRAYPDETCLVRELLRLGESGRQAALVLIEAGGAAALTVIRNLHALKPPFVEGIPVALRILDQGERTLQFAVLDWLDGNLRRLLAWSPEARAAVEPFRQRWLRLMTGPDSGLASQAAQALLWLPPPVEQVIVAFESVNGRDPAAFASSPIYFWLRALASYGSAAAPLRLLLEQMRVSASGSLLEELDRTLAAFASDPPPTSFPDQPGLQGWLARLQAGGKIQEIAESESWVARDPAWVPEIAAALRDRQCAWAWDELVSLLACLIENTGDLGARRVLVAEFDRPKLKTGQRGVLLVNAAHAGLHEVADRVLEWMGEDRRCGDLGSHYFKETGNPAGTEVMAARMREMWDRDAFDWICALGAIGTPEAVAILREAAAQEITSRKSGPWQSWHWALWEIARCGTADDVAFLRAQFSRKPKSAASALLQTLARFPHPDALPDAIKATKLLVEEPAEVRRPLQWAFTYFEKIGALANPAVEAFASALLGERKRNLSAALERFLRRHYPGIAA